MNSVDAVCTVLQEYFPLRTLQAQQVEGRTLQKMKECLLFRKKESVI